MKLSDEYKLMRDCCMFSPDSSINDEIRLLVSKDSLDWDFISKESFYHEIGLFLYRRFKDLGLLLDVPEWVANIFKYAYIRTFFKNSMLQEEYFMICSVFDKEGIECLPLKGISFIGNLYEDIALRFMIDIDIIVKEKDIEKAEKLLIYCLSYSAFPIKDKLQDNCHQIFSKRGKTKVHLELHFDVDYAFDGPNRIVLPDIWGRSSRAERLMSPEDTFFSLAMHQRRLGSPFIFKYMCDVDRLIRKYHNNFNWEFLVHNAKRFGIVAPSFILLNTTKRILGTPIPISMLDRLYIGTIKSFMSKRLVLKSVFIKKGQIRNTNYSYLNLYVFMYDRLIHPLKYILFIDKERFAKFYSLDHNDKKMVDLLYAVRLPYMFFKLALFFFSRIRSLMCQINKVKHT